MQKAICAAFMAVLFTTGAMRSKACPSAMRWPQERWRQSTSRLMNALGSAAPLTNALRHRARVRSARSLQTARQSSRSRVPAALMVALRCVASRARAVLKVRGQQVRWWRLTGFPIRHSGVRAWLSTLSLTSCSHSSIRRHCSVVNGGSSRVILTRRLTKHC